MSVIAPNQQRVLRRPGFHNLMAAYDSAFEQMADLCAGFRDSAHDHFVSVAGDPRIALYLDVLERHPYTSVLRMTYIFADGQRACAEPNAYVRVYHDARQMELTFCEPGRPLPGLGLLGQRMPPGIPGSARNRWGHACFLQRWLSLLLRDGRRWRDFLPVERNIESRLHGNVLRPFQKG